MAQTFHQLQKQIAALQKKADAARAAEITGVVERIKQAIEVYQLTPEQLFGGRGAGKSSKATATKTAAKYIDSNGNTWSGRGPRPTWIKEHLESGGSLDSLLATGGAKATRGTRLKPAKRPAGKKKYKASAVLYRNPDTEATWTGRGPQPRWLKDAIAGGKALSDFQVEPRQ